MTLPASGTITLGQINTELGRSSSATISLKDAETGVYGALNVNSPSRPSGVPPYAVSEWYCYNHQAFAPLLITTPGTGTWTCPTGCTSILVECWGQGGAGGNAQNSGARGGGGAGGGYASRTLAVTPGVGYSYQIGATRTPGAAGVNTWFSSTGTITALAGGNGSNATSNVQAASASGVNFPQTGVTYYQGGNGNTGYGGGGAGSTGVGNNATTTAAGGAKTENGGSGGARGIIGSNGSPGSVYGGGGGGGYANSTTLRSGGSGGQGLIRITNLTVCTPPTTTTTTTVPPTTTTTTTGTGKTVSYFGDTGGCAGATMQFIVNGTTVCSGSSCFGTVTAPIGALLEVYYTTGPKATGFCTNALASIGSTDGGGEYSSDSQIGIGVTAYASYTVTSGSASTIYMNAGLIS